MADAYKRSRVIPTRHSMYTVFPLPLFVSALRFLVYITLCSGCCCFLQIACTSYIYAITWVIWTVFARESSPSHGHRQNAWRRQRPKFDTNEADDHRQLDARVAFLFRSGLIFRHPRSITLLSDYSLASAYKWQFSLQTIAIRYRGGRNLICECARSAIY